MFSLHNPPQPPLSLPLSTLPTHLSPPRHTLHFHPTPNLPECWVFFSSVGSSRTEWNMTRFALYYCNTCVSFVVAHYICIYGNLSVCIDMTISSSIMPLSPLNVNSCLCVINIHCLHVLMIFNSCRGVISVEDSTWNVHNVLKFQLNWPN